jgi:hypothetical protein
MNRSDRTGESIRVLGDADETDAAALPMKRRIIDAL